MLVDAARPIPKTRLWDFIELTKPRLSLLVVFTTGTGLLLAPGSISVARALITLLATTLVVGAANALNCYFEREPDGRMFRTRNRPLPEGRVQPRAAIYVAVGAILVALPILYFAANFLTAMLGLVALVIYAWVYTPMKYHSTMALFVGAVPGAIPPLMGWTAVTNQMDVGGLALFGILFCWQLPHFLAISLYLREDYARGGMKVFSLVHGERLTKIAIVATAFLMIPATVALIPAGIGGNIYLSVAVVLNVWLIGLSLRGFWVSSTEIWARKVFLASIVYLPLLLGGLIVGAQ